MGGVLVTIIWDGQADTLGSRVETNVKLEALAGILQPLKQALRTGAWRRFFLISVKLTTGETASYFNWSGYYEEPNDTPGSCQYMCVENYFGVSGEWGDKSCSETGTTKYLCEKF